VLLQNPAVQNRLYVLALSAIGTTVLGCYLALQSVYRDVVVGVGGVADRHSVSDSTNDTRNNEPLQNKPWFQSLVIAAPPTAIACLSPALFGRAIAFAGAYPVLLLYGVLPAALYLKLHNSDNDITAAAAARVLGFLSIGMVLVSAVTDVRKATSWLGAALLTVTK